MELNSETWNMSPENIVLGDVAFVSTKSDTGLPSYAFSSKCALNVRLVRKGLRPQVGSAIPYFCFALVPRTRVPPVDGDFS